MSEEQQSVHPQEPAEGAEENVRTPGAQKSGDDDHGTTGGPGAEGGSPQHPQQPAEGGEDEVEEPGAEGSG